MKKSDLYKKSILLIGPAGAGKSSVAEKISSKTGLPRYSIDSITKNDSKSGYRDKFKTTDDYNLAIIKALVERAEYGNVSGVIDFGAGHTIYDNPDTFEKAKEIFSRFKNVILLLPSHDIDKSLEILSKRAINDTTINKKALTSPCNRELAKMIVYEKGRNPEQLAKDILRYIKERDKQFEMLEK